MILAILTVTALTVTVVYFIDTKFNQSDEYKYMMGIGICITIQAIICCVMAFLICFGNVTIIE